MDQFKESINLYEKRQRQRLSSVPTTPTSTLSNSKILKPEVRCFNCMQRCQCSQDAPLKYGLLEAVSVAGEWVVNIEIATSLKNIYPCQRLQRKFLRMSKKLKTEKKNILKILLML